MQAKPVPGRPQKISPDEIRWLAKVVKDETPQQLYALWTQALVGEVLARQFGKRLSKGSVSRLMRILGFTVQRPLYRAWQQDPEWVKQWQEDVFPAIRAEASKRDARN